MEIARRILSLKIALKGANDLAAIEEESDDGDSVAEDVAREIECQIGALLFVLRELEPDPEIVDEVSKCFDFGESEKMIKSSY